MMFLFVNESQPRPAIQRSGNPAIHQLELSTINLGLIRFDPALKLRNNRLLRINLLRGNRFFN